MGVALFVSSCSPVVFDEESTPKGEVLITLKQDDKTTATKATENLPEVGEFIVEVTETSSNRLFFRKKYSDAIEQKIALNQGEHRLFAYYGDPEGIGFNSFYYAADQLFDVEANSIKNIEAVAKLANVKVAVNFGPGLALDYKEYYAQAVTARGGSLTFTKKETRPGYVPVGDLTLVLYVYVHDKWMCYKSEPVNCKCNDFVTFNVDTQRLGNLADFQIVISNETEDVVKEIQIPGEAAPQDAPTLTMSGFEGNRLSTVEADPYVHSGLKADIVAMGGIQSCLLNINSTLLSSKGIPSQVDLASADAATLKALEGVGIKFLREMGGKRLSYVDFSDLANYISKNVAYHPDYETSAADFSLEVVDKSGKTCKSETYTIAIDKSQADLVINDYDVWATRFAGTTLTVTKGDPSKYVLKLAKTSDENNSSVQTILPKAVSGNKVTFGELAGLASGTGYKVWAVYNENPYNATEQHQFTTESELQVGNNSFEQHTYESFAYSIYILSTKGTRVWYQPYAAGETDPWWAVNSTATLDKQFTSEYHYYKCFPTVCMTGTDTYNGNRSVIVASVAVNDLGSLILSGDAITGELYIGKADNSAEHKNSHISDGHAFSSRPSKMSFYYKFDYNDSPFAAEIKLLGEGDEVIGSGKFTSAQADVSSWTKAEVPVEYEITDKKAKKIYISFVSSSTGSTDSRDIKLNVLNTSGAATTTENIHAGNVVWLDYVQLYY